MKADIRSLLDAKKQHRKDLARAPIAVKLAKLDALRERAAAIRAGSADITPASSKARGKRAR